MQLSFSKIVAFVPEWNGNRELPDADQIKVKITVCEMGTLLQAMDAFKGAGADDASVIDTDNIDPEKLGGLIEAMKDLLPAHVEISNLKDAGGNELNGDDILKFGTLYGLATELLGELVRVSTPSEADEKN